MRRLLIVGSMGVLSVLAAPTADAAPAPPVCTVELRDDPGPPGAVTVLTNAYVVVGTDGADRIEVNVADGVVTIDASFLDQPFVDVEQHVAVFGCDGNDHITFGDRSTPGVALAYGDGGNDHISAGDTQSGAIFEGGTGNDHLSTGRVTGPFGQVFFTGDAGNDVLVAGDANLPTRHSRFQMTGGDGNDNLTAGDITGVRFQTRTAVMAGDEGRDVCTLGSASEELSVRTCEVERSR